MSTGEERRRVWDTIALIVQHYDEKISAYQKDLRNTCECYAEDRRRIEKGIRKYQAKKRLWEKAYSAAANACAY